MYIILAGGFYGMSYKNEIWGHRNIELGDKDRGVDFIINLKGLPEGLVASEGVVPHYTYYCQKCKALVPEWDMEQKRGCFFHDPEPKREDVKVWRKGVLDEYKNERITWIKGALRIWLDNSQGVEKWKTIKRYIESQYPVTRSLSEITPRPVGTRLEWSITEDNVPSFDLSNGRETVKDMKIDIANSSNTEELVNKLLKKIVELENKIDHRTIIKDTDGRVKPIPCPICGEVQKGALVCYRHVKYTHKEDPNKYSFLKKNGGKWGEKVAVEEKIPDKVE